MGIVKKHAEKMEAIRTDAERYKSVQGKIKINNTNAVNRQ